MTVYTTLLSRGQVIGPVNTAVYTAPLLGRVVVRDIVLYHDDSVVRTVGMYGLSGGVGRYLLSERSAAPKTTYHFDGRQVLLPGEQLFVISDSTGNVMYTITGYVFAS